MSTIQADLTEFLVNTFTFIPDSGPVLDGIVDGILVFGLMVITWIIYLICFQVIERFIGSLIRKSSNTWDDTFLSSRITKRFTRFIPALVLWHWAPKVIRNELAAKISENICSVYLIIVGLTVLFSALNIIERLYQRNKISNQVPLSSFTQTLKILLTIGAIILILSAIIDKSPALIFSGFGALTAVLMLVFKDPILGLAAGIQLSSNRLVAVGDWIEVPRYEANGTVLSMGLTTVRVQNWDMTYTTIPTYSLISDSFKNWKGMQQSGMRRIKRSLLLDLNTIRLLTPYELDKLRKKPLLNAYFQQKDEDFLLDNPNFPHGDRQLTNIGTYRAYLSAYLNAHSTVAKNATQMVRQHQPTSKGLPLEVYCFSSDNNWVNYENLQSDIFDHFISVLSEFHLELYQEQAGKTQY